MENKSIIENNEYLSFLGIYIPQKDSFPQGFIKLYSEDFIVEEIDDKGRLITIEKKDTTSPSLPEEAKFFHATLVKRNIRTNEAIEEIVKQLSCELKQVQTAGLKDEDAITAQKISFERISLSSIKKISSSCFFIKDIHVGQKRIYNGTHQGNRFTILIRTNAETCPIEENKDSVFFNYYYTQRFAVRYASHVWGVYLLRGEYESALKHFLTFDSPQETVAVRTLRKEAAFVYGDWRKMKEIFSREALYFNNEIKVVNELINTPEDIVRALKSIEDQVKLWLYALSSWLFNNKIKDYLIKTETPPSELPLFLSDSSEDWNLYKGFVEGLSIYPPHFENVSPFSSVVVKSNKVSTTARAFVHKISKIEEGFVVSFSLGKGSYATTFLSHYFNLVSKKIPDSFKSALVDIKKHI